MLKSGCRAEVRVLSTPAVLVYHIWYITRGCLLFLCYPARDRVMMSDVARASLGVLTSTILAHWVPFPAPGPPRTNTTCGFMARKILGAFLHRLRSGPPIINPAGEIVKRSPMNERNELAGE